MKQRLFWWGVLASGQNGGRHRRLLPRTCVDGSVPKFRDVAATENRFIGTSRHRSRGSPLLHSVPQLSTWFSRERKKKIFDRKSQSLENKVG